MYPKITSIDILDDYKLLLKFDNNENRVFDVKPFLKYDEFQAINNYDKFREISVDSGSIRWDSGPDISINTVLNQSSVYDTLGENEY
jgi:hypothetical protein